MAGRMGPCCSISPPHYRSLRVRQACCAIQKPDRSGVTGEDALTDVWSCQFVTPFLPLVGRHSLPSLQKQTGQATRRVLSHPLLMARGMFGYIVSSEINQTASA